MGLFDRYFKNKELSWMYDELLQDVVQNPILSKWHLIRLLNLLQELYLNLNSELKEMIKQKDSMYYLLNVKPNRIKMLRNSGKSLFINY